jgi:transcriptional regulator with XRE-family HTH domain
MVNDPESRSGAATDPPTEIGEILGLAVRRLRTTRGISQEALARRLEMSRETVRRIEFGEGTTLATLDRVLEALDYSVADLLAEASATPSYRAGERDRPSAVVLPFLRPPTPAEVA